VNDDSANPVRGPLNRRAVLAAGGVATASAAVLAVAGCATYDSNSSPAPASTGAPGSAGAGATGSAGAASTPAEAAGGNAQAPAGPAGTVLGAASAVPVGGGTIFADQSVVVTQPTAGTFKAFSAICTHQGCTVSSVSGGTINCPCHGSKFTIADGSVAGGPAKRPLPGKQVNESGGQLSVS
jgi:Rieske Fe-S protein